MDGGFLVEVGVAKCVKREQSLISRAITLFPGDTVLASLQVMHQHRLAMLPVVDEDRGELLGEVTEEELCRIASRLPLIRLAEVLTAKAMGGAEGMTDPWIADGGHWLH